MEGTYRALAVPRIGSEEEDCDRPPPKAPGAKGQDVGAGQSGVRGARAVSPGGQEGARCPAEAGNGFWSSGISASR